MSPAAGPARHASEPGRQAAPPPLLPPGRLRRDRPTRVCRGKGQEEGRPDAGLARGRGTYAPDVHRLLLKGLQPQVVAQGEEGGGPRPGGGRHPAEVQAAAPAADQQEIRRGRPHCSGKKEQSVTDGAGAVGSPAGRGEGRGPIRTDARQEQFCAQFVVVAVLADGLKRHLQLPRLAEGAEGAVPQD